MAKVKTKYMTMKELKEQLHWYQHLVRGDIASLKRSKEAVYRVAKAMREVQKT